MRADEKAKVEGGEGTGPLDFRTRIHRVRYVFAAAMKSNAGHFTQVVWKGSREIGIGRAMADKGQSIYVVCNYFPAGNVIGRFKENVFPAK